METTSSTQDMYLDLGAPEYAYGEPVQRAFGIGRVFKSGWKLFVEQPVLTLLAGLNILLIAVVQFALNFIFGIAQVFLEIGASLSPELAQVFGGFTDLITTPFFLLLNMIAYAGAYIAFAHYIRNGGVSYATLYTSIGPAFRALFMGILQALIALGILIVFMIPGAGCMLIDPLFGAIVLVLGIFLSFLPLIYVGLGFQLSVHALVLDDVGIFEAMRVSWRAASGARLELFALSIVFGALYIIANCCLLVPLMFVSAIHMAGLTAGWMAYSRSREDTQNYPFFQTL